ncbi:MAG: sigma-70 family RNA polymerase sigma factor [Actinomycetota bacterium]
MTFEPEGPLSPDQEQVLMQQLIAGEERAIRVLYARFARPVYTLGLRLLGSAEAAEELTQDVFLAAWRKGSRFDAARGRLSTWLMAVAHNLAVDRLRHDRGAGRPVLVFVDELPEGTPAEEEETLIERETARQALAGLSATERQLLSRAYFQGWTAREISEADGIPLGTVKTRLRTALIKLRKAHHEEARLAAAAGEREPA